MNICNSVWRTLYEHSFEHGKYLYHFTDKEKALKILYYRTLKFSKLCITNDTLESKPKIYPLTNNTSNIYLAIEHFRNINKEYLQLLCFTRDSDTRTGETDSLRKYTDYSGRGFALPRMWAQYAKNNSGVCIVFDKQELIKLIQRDVGDISLIYHDDIKYLSQFEPYGSNSNKLSILLQQIDQIHNSEQQSYFNIEFLKRNTEFVKYNYFSKLDDWKGENEYRFLAYGKEDFYIHDIEKAILGVVIGEKMEEDDAFVIGMLCDEICEMKKISFSYKGCQLETISSEVLKEKHNEHKHKD